MKNDNVYVIFAAVFIILSLVGVYYLVFVRGNNNAQYTSEVPGYTQPTTAPDNQDSDITEPDNTDDSAAPTSSLPTVSPKATSEPTPAFITYTNQEDGFSVVHSSSRKVYADKEAAGNRYTFYKTGANIAIHVGTIWSWEHPGRTFTDNLLLSGQPTFRYDINSMTLVDAQNKGKNYTVQCIHNGGAEAKSECEDFLKSFKFL